MCYNIPCFSFGNGGWIIIKMILSVVDRLGGAEGRHDGRGHVCSPGAGNPLCHACWSPPRDAPADGAHAALLHGPAAGAVGRPTQRTVRLLLLWLSLSQGFMQDKIIARHTYFDRTHSQVNGNATLSTTSKTSMCHTMKVDHHVLIASWLVMFRQIRCISPAIFETPLA